MKIGLFYEDKFTHEVFECINFTRCYYVWKDKSGKEIQELKEQAWKHMNLRAVKEVSQ
jgi:hypothetical protein